jgi:hypothetical protein
MGIRRFITAAFVIPFALAIGEANSSASSSASRERVPAPSTTLVPAVIVLAAIGATVARMNRRGGPR